MVFSLALSQKVRSPFSIPPLHATPVHCHLATNFAPAPWDDAMGRGTMPYKALKALGALLRPLLKAKSDTHSEGPYTAFF